MNTDNEMTLTQADFLALCQVAMESRTGNWRRGQALFNKLAEIQPDLAKYIRGHSVWDAFYRDDKIPAFLAAMATCLEH